MIITAGLVGYFKGIKYLYSSYFSTNKTEL